jgi:hypothetical protein
MIGKMVYTMLELYCGVATGYWSGYHPTVRPRAQAVAFKKFLAPAGYEYLNLDDCWMVPI